MAFSRVNNSLSRNKAARALLYPAIAVRRALLRRREALRFGIAKNVQELLVDDPIIRVAEFEGSFLVDRRSDVFARIVVDGFYEPELAAICVANLDAARDAIDVGANVGFYTNLMARHLGAGRVLAIEPTARALEKLRFNVEHNGIGPRTLVFEGVASDRECVRQLHTIPGKEEYSSVGSLVHASVAGQRFETHDVQASTIDALVSRHGLDPGFIKIDVEGAELSVLRGAEATLKKHRPVVLSELSDHLLRTNGSSAAEVVEYMRRLAYEVVDPFNPDGTFAERDCSEMWCVPRERIAAPAP